MKICIFGGAFNPPHNGHTGLIQAINAAFNFDRIIIIPTYIPPHKNIHYIVECRTRLTMTKLAFSDISNCYISDIEINRKDVSYTIDTLKELKKKIPYAEFTVLIGADNFNIIDEWKNISELIKLTDFIVCRRPGNTIKQSSMIYMKNSTRFVFFENEMFDISSTFIREQLIKGKNEIIAKMLAKPVFDYIIENNIYYEQDKKN